MSRFKSIRNKINKNSSMSVDEKLAALDKELEKTGISNVSEMMTTDNVLSTSEYVPPKERIVEPVPKIKELYEERINVDKNFSSDEQSKTDNTNRGSIN